MTTTRSVLTPYQDGCQCPAIWHGVVPPPCPVHNPATPMGWTITTSGAPRCEHEREGHSYLPIAEMTRLRAIEEAARSAVDGYFGGHTAEHSIEMMSRLRVLFSGEPHAD